jgi:hypothetical protein
MMTTERVRSTAGLLAGILILLCSVLHTLAWRSLESRLDAAQIPDGLKFDVAVIWHFGGAAILVFGSLMVILFAKRLRGRNVTMAPVVVVAAFYVAFGSFGVVVKGASPFLFAFLVPGFVLFVAAPRVSDQRPYSRART